MTESVTNGSLHNGSARANGGTAAANGNGGTRSHRILVTGACGFVGFHLCRCLFAEGWDVIGWDTESVHYPTTTIRHRRKAKLLAEAPPSFLYKDVNIESATEVAAAWDPAIHVVVHLAARAGVRESLTEPAPYIATNLLGHFNVMEAARKGGVDHFIYASSSSVYGADSKLPFAEGEACNAPLSLYAATKKADELMAYSYSHLYALPTTGLRFFTVYGPWGRPDMAVYDFASRICSGRPITMFNGGTNRRAFTFIDDVVAGILGCITHPPTHSRPAFKLYNLGSREMVTTSRLVELLEAYLGERAKVVMEPGLACDMTETGADLSAAEAELHYKPRVAIEKGLAEFVAWYQDFYAEPENQTLR